VRDRLDTLEAAERYNLVSDLWADVLKGGSEAGDFLALVGRLGDEREVDVWEAALAGLGELDRVVSSDIRPDLQQFSSNLVSGKADEMGWEPAAGEDDRTRKLRGLLIRARGNLANDQPTQEAARLMLNEVRENPAGVDSEIADAALFVTAANGDIDDFDRFIDISNTSQNPQEIVKNLRAAATVPGRDAAKRLFELVLDGDVRSQDAFWVLAVMLGDRENGPYVWELMKERWDEMMEALPPTTGAMGRDDGGASADDGPVDPRSDPVSLRARRGRGHRGMAHRSSHPGRRHVWAAADRVDEGASWIAPA
jgi:aminopeptidase N